jgi:hypothetical protein
LNAGYLAFNGQLALTSQFQKRSKRVPVAVAAAAAAAIAAAAAANLTDERVKENELPSVAVCSFAKLRAAEERGSVDSSSYFEAGHWRFLTAGAWCVAAYQVSMASFPSALR